MEKVIGYAISIIGILIIVVGFGTIDVGVKIPETNTSYIIGIGVVAVIAGVFISLKSKDSKRKIKNSGEKELPIYEGVGKNRKVVGYRKD